MIALFLLLPVFSGAASQPPSNPVVFACERSSTGESLTLNTVGHGRLQSGPGKPAQACDLKLKKVSGTRGAAVPIDRYEFVSAGCKNKIVVLSVDSTDSEKLLAELRTGLSDISSPCKVTARRPAGLKMLRRKFMDGRKT